MLGQGVEVGLLLGELGLELQELLLLALPDGPVLGGTLALLEGITGKGQQGEQGRTGNGSRSMPRARAGKGENLRLPRLRGSAGVAGSHAEGRGGQGAARGAQGRRADGGGKGAKHFGGFGAKQ